MNELLIKLRALFTGSGFTDAEAGLKRVKAVADEAAKATTKATTAASAGGGKMFTPQESKDLARSIMAEAIEKAEAAENALRKVEDQANQTKAALQGGGTSGVSGGGIIGWIGRVGAALAVGIGLGKAASSQIEKTGESVKRYLEIAKDFGQAQRDMANASSFDQIVAGLQHTDAAIQEARKNLEAYRSDWGAWFHDMLNGWKFSQAMADGIRGMEAKQFSGGLEGANRNLEVQRKVAAVADDPAAIERIRRDARCREAVANLQEQIDKAPSWSSTAISEGKQQMQALLAGFAAEDDLLNQINARKQEEMRRELEIEKAKRSGNQADFERLQWIKEYTAALQKAKAAGMQDADSFAREVADSKVADTAAEFQREMEKARQEGLARQHAEEEAARKKALAAEKAAAKAAADAKIEEAERASRLQDMELEGRLGESRPGREQRDLERLRDYKNALSQLTEGLTPGTAAWSAAAAKAGEIADNLARAKSNQDKLNASASPDSPDGTHGGAGRIAAERARAEERAQRLEGFGAYGAAEGLRKRAYERAERAAAKELYKMDDRSTPQEDKRGPLERDRDERYAAEQAKRRKGVGDGLMSGRLDKPAEQPLDPATAAANAAVENVANAKLDASAAALNNAASALSQAAAALHDVGRYAD